ncbi:hypothetical protein ACDX78_04260 [Virgibacillus oceani]
MSKVMYIYRKGEDYMVCSNCEQETGEGKFCANCGAQLQNEESAATSDAAVHADAPAEPGGEDVQLEKEDNSEQSQSNEFVEKIKNEAANFGNFLIRMLKSPSEATKSRSNELIPGIITMVIFSLLIALGTYMIARSLGSFFVEISFVDSFVVPLVQSLILFAVVSVLTFGGTKLTGYALSFTDVVAKAGAYSIPFLALSLLGGLLASLGLTTAGALVVLGLLGIILMIPTFVILEKTANGFDRMYVLLGIYIVSFFIASFLIQDIIGIFMGSMLDNIIGGFGF